MKKVYILEENCDECPQCSFKYDKPVICCITGSELKVENYSDQSDVLNRHFPSDCPLKDYGMIDEKIYPCAHPGYYTVAELKAECSTLQNSLKQLNGEIAALRSKYESLRRTVQSINTINVPKV